MDLKSMTLQEMQEYMESIGEKNSVQNRFMNGFTNILLCLLMR